MDRRANLLNQSRWMRRDGESVDTHKELKTYRHSHLRCLDHSRSLKAKTILQVRNCDMRRIRRLVSHSELRRFRMRTVRTAASRRAALHPLVRRHLG